MHIKHRNLMGCAVYPVVCTTLTRQAASVSVRNAAICIPRVTLSLNSALNGLNRVEHIEHSFRKHTLVALKPLVSLSLVVFSLEYMPTNIETGTHRTSTVTL